MAGGEERLGTLSIYMDTIISLFKSCYCKAITGAIFSLLLHGYIFAGYEAAKKPRKAFRIYGFRTNGR